MKDYNVSDSTEPISEERKEQLKQLDAYLRQILGVPDNFEELSKIFFPQTEEDVAKMKERGYSEYEVAMMQGALQPNTSKEFLEQLIEEMYKNERI